MDTYREYWIESVESALSEEGINVTEEQIGNIAEAMQGAHECIGMAFGYDNIPNPLKEENKRLEQELETEKRKVFCKDCNGKGIVEIQGPYHSSISCCYACNGTGKVLY